MDRKPMRLIGRYYHALEQKGRLSIPVIFRQQLDNDAVLTTGLDGCLFIFPLTDWEKIAQEALSRPVTNKKARDWIRLLSNNAVIVTFDALGRILIPDHLKEHAELNKRVCIVGSLNRIEIWDQDRYHRYLEDLEINAEAIAESISHTD
jgi:MraZ protein